MSPISTGDLITAVQFNELVTSYNKLWGDNVASAIFADIATNFDEHSHGWGQATAEPTVSPETIIETEHTNRLLAQMNAGLYHYDTTSSLIPHFSTTVIDASYITSTIEDNIVDMGLLANRFKSESDIALLEASDDASPTWTDTITSVGKAEFTNYDEARYFFNSGGKLTIDLDSIDGDWDDIFTTTGQLVISALNVVNGGTNLIDPLLTKGFYGINPNVDYTEVFSVIGYVASGEYSGSAYSNRSIKISLKGEETVVGGVFNLYIKVTLTDDATSGTINSQLNADYGYISQNTTPVIPSGSNDTYFIAGVHVYQFIQREVPTITVDTSWTI